MNINFTFKDVILNSLPIHMTFDFNNPTDIISAAVISILVIFIIHKIHEDSITRWPPF